jgi:hypothetical protein
VPNLNPLARHGELAVDWAAALVASGEGGGVLGVGAWGRGEERRAGAMVNSGLSYGVTLGSCSFTAAWV